MSTSMTAYAPLSRMASMDPVDELLGYHANHYDEPPLAGANSLDNLEALISGFEPAQEPEVLDLWSALGSSTMSVTELDSLGAVSTPSDALPRSPDKTLSSSSATSSPKNVITSDIHKSQVVKRPKKVARKPASFPVPLPAASEAAPPSALPAAELTESSLTADEQLVDAPGSEGMSADDEDKKRSERMMRNRASAAESRKRKRAHVEELEALVATLKASVAALTAENVTLKAQVTAHGATACDDEGDRAGAPGKMGVVDFELAQSELPDELPMLVSFPSANSAACA